MNQLKKQRNTPIILLICLVFVLCATAIGYNYILLQAQGSDIGRSFENNTKLNDELIKLRNENNKLGIKLDQMNVAMTKSKELGARIVTASMLNIRQDPSTSKEPIGQLFMNMSVKVVDTSNPLWYSVELELSTYQAKKGKVFTVFSDRNGNEVGQIENKFMDSNKPKTGIAYFLHSNYLSEQEVVVSTNAPEKPSNPFTYGLLFFDKKISEKLENDIWTELSEPLKKMGYDGVAVIPVTRKTFKDDVMSGKYDAVESAPGDFVSVNKDGIQLEAFAKTVNKLNNSSSYTGLIIANKKSGIKSFEDIKGKTIYTNDTFSESGYKYQKYYLEKFHNINIENEKKVTNDFEHQEVFLKVATGEAEVGFVGDFVMFTDPLYRINVFAEPMGIQLTSDRQLEELRNNVVILSMDELSEIPNNPHSITKALYGNKDLVNKLSTIVKKDYDNYREDFGLTDAISSEYDFLLEFE